MSERMALAARDRGSESMAARFTETARETEEASTRVRGLASTRVRGLTERMGQGPPVSGVEDDAS
ncbi:hypothetical protein JOF53_001872 [Crossiella equi]|uniref:Uncharacterized protein n=1 Tax=Crossiella equi TaxID=130796 RepID=A0ABS5A8V9_9PSEU|nr:hypothetical protein [Crossiella equi]MBP2473000.1 hypothetical protein [Crossiella equi]